MNSKLTVTLVAVAMMTVFLPTVAAQLDFHPDWQTPGDRWGADNYAPPEPNVRSSAFDEDPTRMWQDPPNLATLDPDGDGEWDDRIYFDMVLDTAQGTGLPHYSDEANNIAIRSYPETSYYAFLGYWRDCNGDNFMGDLGTMRMQYPADQANFPIDQQLCPAPELANGNPNPDFDAKDRFFNDGEQVREFVPIGPGVRDLFQGEGDKATCQQRNGGPSGDTADDTQAQGTPRANDDFVLREVASGNVPAGNENVFCDGSRVDWIQDDYAKVWFDLLFPNSPPKPTGAFCIPPLPCQDGTYRDSNGAFRAVDGQVLGLFSQSTFGLWPSEVSTPGETSSISDTDPDPGNQCERHGDPVFYRDADSGASGGPVEDQFAAQDPDYDTSHDPPKGDETYDDQGTAVSNANAWANGGVGTCSPIPNFAYVTLPVLGKVAYPGFIMEQTFDSNEDPSVGERNQGILGEPFYWKPSQDASSSDHCNLNTQPGTWDGEDDTQDGSPVDDPFGGGAPLADPIGWGQGIYGPSSGGPSINPTWRSIESSVMWRAQFTAWAANPTSTGETKPECTSSGGLWTFESSGAVGQGGQGKRINQADGGFWNPLLNFNPSRDAGADGAAGQGTDTYLCSRAGPPTAVFSLLGGGSHHKGQRCEAFWMFATFIDVPNEVPLIRSFLRTDASVAYADVSFGDADGGATPSAFDPRGDGAFDSGAQGIWDATNPPGYDSNTPWTVALFGNNPNNELPGDNDQHAYGAESCSNTAQTGIFGQSLELQQVESTPKVYDAEKEVIVTDTSKFDGFTLPTSGQDYTIDVGALDATEAAISTWSCDRSLWAITSGLQVTVRDPNNPGSVDTVPGCNLYWWTDDNNDGLVQPEEISQEGNLVGNTLERQCYFVEKPGDPYDLRDFECYDNDFGPLTELNAVHGTWTGETYDDLRTNLNQGNDEDDLVMGAKGNDQNLYFDCDNPTNGRPFP